MVGQWAKDRRPILPWHLAVEHPPVEKDRALIGPIYGKGVLSLDERGNWQSLAVQHGHGPGRRPLLRDYVLGLMEGAVEYPSSSLLFHPSTSIHALEWLVDWLKIGVLYPLGIWQLNTHLLRKPKRKRRVDE